MQQKFHPLQVDSPPLRRSPNRASLCRQVQAVLQPPSGFWAALLEAIVWMAAATALRLAADLILTAAPELWIPVAFVLIAPAMAAVCLSTWAPQLSLILGYRLLLVALGLLIGGKL